MVETFILYRASMLIRTKSTTFCNSYPPDIYPFNLYPETLSFETWPTEKECEFTKTASWTIFAAEDSRIRRRSDLDGRRSFGQPQLGSLSTDSSPASSHFVSLCVSESGMDALTCSHRSLSSRVVEECQASTMDASLDHRSLDYDHRISYQDHLGDRRQCR